VILFVVSVTIPKLQSEVSEKAKARTRPRGGRWPRTNLAKGSHRMRGRKRLTLLVSI